MLVNHNCRQCGAALPEAAAFCGVCGAKQNDGATRVCSKCGTLTGDAKFCGKCGTPVAAAEPPAPAATAWQPVTPSAGYAAPAAAGATAKPSKGKSKFLLIVAGIVVGLLILLAAGVAYVVNGIRHKAEQAEAGLHLQKDLAAAAVRARQSAAPGITPAAGSGTATQATPSLRTLTDEERAKSLTDAGLVALAIEKNAGKQPADIPSSALPAGTSAITASPTGGYTWESGGAQYTWDSTGLRVTTADGTSNYGECAIGRPANESTTSAPEAAAGNLSQDWAQKNQRIENGPEADLVVRTGDINNLGFGWPQGFDPFSGQSTPPHPYPWKRRAGEPQGTDLIMVGSVYGGKDQAYDGYSRSSYCNCPAGWPACQARLDSMPEAVVLSVGALPAKIEAVLFQIFVDDFQPQAFHSHFQVSLNDTRIPDFEAAINSLDQTGPVGKLLTLRLLPEYWPLLQSGTVKLYFDDPTTHKGDGYAVDFVRILVNPHQLKYQVSLTATVTDADKHTPIAGANVNAALVSATTDSKGKCELTKIPAGLVVATASAPGYDENSVNVDLPAGKAGQVEIPLHPHQESAAALEQSIAQTGTATIYGIHFDTDSSKLRPDSLDALNAVLALVNNHPGSKWQIAGHTDSQGTAARNLPLSQARAASVVTWLQQHGADVTRLVPQGFGDTRPVADNTTANGRALNRRVEVALVK
jgi:outer membrane protein OmpA-like peptidoglycan-associated protein